jgi:hypothetical protein
MRFALLTAFMTLTTVAAAQTYVPPVGQRVKSGVPTRVQSYFVCVARGGVGLGTSGAARHGTITVREGRENRCGMRDYPVAELWYTSHFAKALRDSLDRLFLATTPPDGGEQ